MNPTLDYVLGGFTLCELHLVNRGLSPVVRHVHVRSSSRYKSPA